MLLTRDRPFQCVFVLAKTNLYDKEMAGIKPSIGHLT